MELRRRAKRGNGSPEANILIRAFNDCYRIGTSQTTKAPHFWQECMQNRLKTVPSLVPRLADRNFTHTLVGKCLNAVPVDVTSGIPRNVSEAVSTFRECMAGGVRYVMHICFPLEPLQLAWFAPLCVQARERHTSGQPAGHCGR